VIINTTNFGELQIDEKMAIHFDEGIAGFPEDKDFVILNNWDTEEPVPFMWLQSIEKEDLALVISIPFLLRSDYEFEIPDEICEKLGLSSPENVGVYTVCKIQDKIENMTFNLVSPIIVNTENRKAMQFQLMNDDYKINEVFIQK